MALTTTTVYILKMLVSYAQVSSLTSFLNTLLTINPTYFLAQIQLVAISLAFRFVWLVETIALKVVLRSTTMEHGALSVMITGTSQMQRLSADSLVLMELLKLCQMPTLEQAVEACPFFLMMSSALATSKP